MDIKLRKDFLADVEAAVVSAERKHPIPSLLLAKTRVVEQWVGGATPRVIVLDTPDDEVRTVVVVQHNIRDNTIVARLLLQIVF